MGGTAASGRVLPAVVTTVGRAVIAGGLVGIAFGVVLTLSRELLGGRPVPFWLENTAGAWLVAAFVAGALARRPASGALAGAGALVLALVLHDTVSFVTDTGLSVQLLPFVRPGWSLASAVVGAGVGVASGWAATAPERWWLSVAVLAGVLVGEAAALFAGGLPPHVAFDGRVGAVQAVVGVVGVVAAVRWSDLWRALLVTAGVAIAVLLVEMTTGLVTRLVWG